MIYPGFINRCLEGKKRTSTSTVRLLCTSLLVLVLVLVDSSFIISLSICNNGLLFRNEKLAATTTFTCLFTYCTITDEKYHLPNTIFSTSTLSHAGPGASTKLDYHLRVPLAGPLTTLSSLACFCSSVFYFIYSCFLLLASQRLLRRS
jgi:hypothetical protein